MFKMMGSNFTESNQNKDPDEDYMKQADPLDQGFMDVGDSN